MNKEEYLKKLEQLLSENSISNKEEIIDKYKKRFMLAEEAEMSINDTIEMLGTPEEVVSKYLNKIDVEKQNDNELYNLRINDAIIDEIIIKNGNEDKIIVNASEDLIDCIDIFQEGKTLIINDKKFKKFFTKSVGELEIIIGKNIKFASVEFNLVNTDVKIEELITKRYQMNIVNGDIDADRIISGRCEINVVSGDHNIKYLKADDLVAATVSGDINVDYIDVKNASFDTVSGDINATGKVQNKKGTSISGDINIREMK